MLPKIRVSSFPCLWCLFWMFIFTKYVYFIINSTKLSTWWILIFHIHTDIFITNMLLNSIKPDPNNWILTKKLQLSILRSFNFLGCCTKFRNCFLKQRSAFGPILNFWRWISIHIYYIKLSWSLIWIDSEWCEYF